MQHATSTCPICNRLATAAHTPFCSNRCHMRDLGKWLDGSYTVPIENGFGEEDEAPNGLDDE